MEDKNINNNHDSGFKKISIEFPESLLEFVGLNDYKIVRRLDKSVDFNNIVSKDGDCLFETDSGELIHIEFQSSDNIYKKDLNRFLLYSSYYRMVEDKDVISVIIYGKKIKDRGYFINTRTLVYRPVTVFLADINAEDILYRIKDKLYKGIRLQKSDVMLLTMIPEFTTPQDESYYVRESLEILDHLNVSIDLIDILGIFFNKEGEFAKMIDENKRLDGPVKKYGELVAKRTADEVTRKAVLELINSVPVDVIAKAFNVSIEYVERLIRESKSSNSGMNSFKNM